MVLEFRGEGICPCTPCDNAGWAPGHCPSPCSPVSLCGCPPVYRETRVRGDSQEGLDLPAVSSCLQGDIHQRRQSGASRSACGCPPVYRETRVRGDSQEGLDLPAVSSCLQGDTRQRRQSGGSRTACGCRPVYRETQGRGDSQDGLETRDGDATMESEMGAPQPHAAERQGRGPPRSARALGRVSLASRRDRPC